MNIDAYGISNTSFAETSSHVAGTKENMGHHTPKDMAVSGYRLDISGIVKDNAASSLYAKSGKEVGQGKTIEECLQGIAGQDISVMHNYMAVVSNSLSAEDFAKISKDGFSLKDLSAEDSVTVIDQIKVRLAQSGTIVAGYTDTVDSDTVKAVTGSEAAANQIEASFRKNDMPYTSDNAKEAQKALDMAGELDELAVDGGLSDESICYLLESGAELTLENVYRAQFSNMGAVPAGTVTENSSEYQQLLPQIQRIIEKSGREADNETVEDALWLINHRQALTEDTLTRLGELKGIALPLDREFLLDGVASALSEGKGGTDALLVKNARVTAEARLEMTSDAAVRMLMRGIEVDTSDLQDQVEALKELEQKLAGASAEVMADTLEKVDEIRSLPIAVIGSLSAEDHLTLSSVYEKGVALKATYDAANSSYEALRTEIRSDLGDSIKKAFANVDDILEDMNLDTTESNRRAVRILGYNSTEITHENISAVKEVDSKVTGVIDRLNPASVLRLIREGRNPLNMNVDELRNTLDEYNREDGRAEKYSEYLWKLEKNGQISEDEKESFIGIYRLFRQVEKSDGAVIGSLVNSGAEINVKNLLSAVRSRKARGEDYRVDDSFGGLEEKIPEGVKRIDVQISQAFQSADYYERKNGDVLDTIDPSKLERMWEEGRLTTDTSLEEIADYMRYSGSDMSKEAQAAQESYNERSAADIRAAMKASDEVILALEQYDMPVSSANLQAMSGLLYDRGDFFRQLAKYGKEVRTAELIEEFDNKDAAVAAMDDLVEKSEEMISSAMESADISYGSLEDLMLMSRQIRLIGTMARQENYEVPLELEDGMTSINLRLVHGDESGKVEATLYTDEYGPLSMSMSMDGNSVSGYMLASYPEGKEFLEEKIEQLKESAQKEGFEVDDNIPVISTRDIRMASTAQINPAKGEDDNSEKSDVSSSRLYKLAKIFLTVMNS